MALLQGEVQRRLALIVLEARVRPRFEERLGAASMAIASSVVQRRHHAPELRGIHVGALRDEVVEAIELAIAGRVHEGRGAGPTPATRRLGINVHPLPQEAGEGGEVAVLRRLAKMHHLLLCDGGGILDKVGCVASGVRAQQPDDLRLGVFIGEVQRRLPVLVLEARVRPRFEERLDAGSTAISSSVVQRRLAIP